MRISPLPSCALGVLVLLALALPATTREAHADTDETLVLVEGPADFTWIELAKGRTEVATRQLGRQPLDARMVVLPPGQTYKSCFQMNFSGCGRKALARFGASSTIATILVLNVAEDGGQGTGNIVVTAWLLQGSDGTGITNNRLYCERCEGGAFQGMMDEFITGLLRSASGSLVTTKLRVESSPSPAEVHVDNTPIGVTPVETSTTPGPHTVTVKRDGYQLAVRTVEAKKDQVVTVTVPLEPVPRQAPPFRVWKWVTLGAGVGVGVAGGYIFSQHEGEVEDGDRRPRYRHTHVPGAVLMGAGAALLVTSAIMFWQDARKRPVDVDVALGPLGGSVNVTGRF